MLNHFDHEKINVVFSSDQIFENLNRVKTEHFNNIKIKRCRTNLIDVIGENHLEEIISIEHLKNNHRGIHENYEELKIKYYYPLLFQKITEFVNNCDICILSKYERNPKLVPFMVSETPKKPNEIIHMEIFYSINKTIFL